MKTCTVCSSTFEPNSNRQRYCSEGCRNGGGATCKGCGATFERSRASRHKQKYCSRACYARTDARTANRTCGTCGGDTHPGRKYCSSKCAHVALRAHRITKTCVGCSVEFATKASLRRKYCSRSCNVRSRNWAKARFKLGDTTLHTSGYVIVKTESGWKMQHRLLMEQLLGRPLEPHERVHHKNGVRADNRPENLELWKIKSSKDPAGVRSIDYHCPGCRCGAPMN